MTINRLEYRSTDACVIGYTDLIVRIKDDKDVCQPFVISVSGYDTVVKALTAAIHKGTSLSVTQLDTGALVEELKPLGKWRNHSTKIGDLVHAVMVHESIWDPQTEKPIVLAWDGDLVKSLFAVLDERFKIPLLEEWTPWILAQLEAGDYIFDLDVMGDTSLKAVRLNLTEEQLGEIAGLGLAKGYIKIPDTAETPETIERLEGISNVTEYLKGFAPDLARRITEKYKPVHNPDIDEAHPRLAELKRTLFPAQAHVATGLAKTLENLKADLVCGEMGTGKTIIGSAVPYLMADGRPYRVLVMCPGHLVVKWAREIEATIPGAKATIIQDWRQLVLMHREMPRKPVGIEYHVISKDRAKLGYFITPSARWDDRRGVWSCSECGQVITDRDGVPVPEAFFDEPNSSNRFCSNMVWKRTWDEENKCWLNGDICNAKLWGADSKLRRFAPAEFIKKFMKGYYQMFVADECHEMKGDTGQGNVFGMLAKACGKTLALTGTLLGGYAADLFYILFRMSPETMKAEGLSYSSLNRWESRYGIVEKRIHEKSEDELLKSAKGTKKKSTTSYRRPGVSPMVFSRHLLEKVAFLELQDLAEHLPSYSEIVETVEMDYGLETGYKELEEAIADFIKRNRFSSSARGMVGTQLNTLLAYPDNPYNWEPIVVKKTGEVVTTPKNLDPDILWPKEERLLELIRKERAEGRRVYVFATYTGQKNDVTERLEKIVSEAGFKVAVLKRTVKPEKREAWLANKCKQGYEVVISNAKLVETGLDLTGSTNFPTLIWYQTGYNLFTLRQASRRSWRIGQKQPVRVYFLAYEGTLQTSCLALMGTKLEASMTLEGKFSEEGLRALADSTDMTSALAKALIEGMGEIESAEKIWARLGYSKLMETSTVPDAEEVEPETSSVVETEVAVTEEATFVVESKVKVKSTVLIVEVGIHNKKKTVIPVQQLGWDWTA